jgi:hypothetical protein
MTNLILYNGAYHNFVRSVCFAHDLDGENEVDAIRAIQEQFAEFRSDYPDATGVQIQIDDDRVRIIGFIKATEDEIDFWKNRRG